MKTIHVGSGLKLIFECNATHTLAETLTLEPIVASGYSIEANNRSYNVVCTKKKTKGRRKTKHGSNLGTGTPAHRYVLCATAPTHNTIDQHGYHIKPKSTTMYYARALAGHAEEHLIGNGQKRQRIEAY
jgi:hypothetical protein